ncbi:MAG: sugar phosphate isomerase/epimerase family protein, partial [Terriglobia bacterium]
MSELKLGRREFLVAGGVSALGASVGLPEGGPEAAGRAGRAERAEQADTLGSANTSAHEKGFPQLAMITRYSPEKLAFAASAGYQGAVITVDRSFNPGLPDSEIANILSASRQTGVRIISIECMAPNHIDSDPARRRAANEDFIHCLEFSHQLGCKFTGTFSGGIPGASMEDQAKALAEVVNEKYIPVCEKLGMGMGWENYPTGTNFATTPAAWSAVFSRVPSKLLGLEFDPSQLVRQFIDPYHAAWDFRDRILAVHAKDTEITEPVLQQVGIHGQGWWRYRIPGQGRIDWPKF